MKDYINIIGGGLAGCEAAYQISKRGINVRLYEMKPTKYSPAHSNSNLAEIVCSNSFKSNLLTNACGLLKEELRMLDSLLIKIADETSVPAGQALAVDREEFSRKVTEYIENVDNVINSFPADLNIVGAEMESFALFYTAKMLGKSAACLLTVVDSIKKKASLSAEDRQKSLNDMIKLALDTSIKLT